jgi:hypothetical protein
MKMPTTLADLHVPSIKPVDAEAAPVTPSPVANSCGVKMLSLPTIDVIRAATAAATDTVASLSDDPAVLRSLILRALDAGPKPLDAVLGELSNARAELPEAARRPLLEALFPLLSTQGELARPLARRIAVALAITNAKAVLEASGLPPEAGSMTLLLRRAGNVLNRDAGKLEIAAEVALFTGDEELAELLHGDRQGQQLEDALATAFEQIQRSMATLSAERDRYDDQLGIAQSMERNADELERQFNTQLYAISRRIEVLRRHIAEDIENLSENGGEEAEVDLRRASEKRGILQGSDDHDVRERMVTKGLARRHNDLKRRHDEQIQLLRDELSNFRESCIEAERSVIAPISLADWRIAIPGTTRSARVKDALDRSANRTLTGGVVAVAGTAGAVGAHLIAPVVVVAMVTNPVGIAAMGFVAVACAWKLYANRDERLRRELRDRAEAIRRAAHTKVEQAFADVSIALDEVAEGFREVSLSRIAPLRQDAERIREMCVLQKKLVQRISSDAQGRLSRWQQALGCEPASKWDPAHDPR